VTSNTRTPLRAPLSGRCICADGLLNQISGCSPSLTVYGELTGMYCMQMVCAYLSDPTLRNNLGMKSGKLADNLMSGWKTKEAGLHDSHNLGTDPPRESTYHDFASGGLLAEKSLTIWWPTGPTPSLL
jgi:hypothetical protein